MLPDLKNDATPMQCGYILKNPWKETVTNVKTVRIVTIVKTNQNNSDTSVFHQRPLTFKNQDQSKQQ